MEESNWTDRVRNRSVTKSQEEEYRTKGKNEASYMDWSRLAQELPF